MLKTMVLFALSLSCSGFIDSFKNNNGDNKEDIPWFSLVIQGPRNLKSDFSCVVFSRWLVVKTVEGPICWILSQERNIQMGVVQGEQGCGRGGVSDGGTWLLPFKPARVPQYSRCGYIPSLVPLEMSTQCVVPTTSVPVSSYSTKLQIVGGFTSMKNT